jgi:hypothetical protein
MKINFDFIKKTEIAEYVNYRSKHTKSLHEIKFEDEVESKDYLKNILSDFVGNSSYKSIYGVDSLYQFELKIYDISKLHYFINDIYKNPTKYVEFLPAEDFYYDFIKYLYVSSGRTKSSQDQRLCDLKN